MPSIITRIQRIVTPGSFSGSFQVPHGISTFVDRTQSTTEAAYAYPFYIPTPKTIDRVIVFLTTAGAASLLRMGIYSNKDGVPYKLLCDCGETDTSAGGGADIALVVSLRAVGMIWVMSCTNTTATPAIFKGVNTPASAGSNVISTSLSGAAVPRLYLGLTPSTYPVSAMPTDAALVLPTSASTNAGPCPMLRFA